MNPTYQCKEYAIFCYIPDQFEIFDLVVGEFIPGIWNTEADAKRWADRILVKRGGV